MNKKLLARNIIIAWIILIGICIDIFIESYLISPWTRITNIIWILGMIGLAYYIYKIAIQMLKYHRGTK